MKSNHFYRLFLPRYVCTKALDKANLKLGGEDVIVEIDESMFKRVKHHRGKDMRSLAAQQLWVFGMIERKEKGKEKTFMIVVKYRDARSLLKLIYNHCLPGTILYSDCWKAYNKIPKLDKRFKHFTVNHKLHFVDKLTGVHTNKIESNWRKAKAKMRLSNGIKRGYVEAYLNVFLWKQNAENKDLFQQLLNDIKKVFPLDSKKKSW
jgi:transposase-like protein